jgi:hypothetical protein
MHFSQRSCAIRNEEQQMQKSMQRKEGRLPTDETPHSIIEIMHVSLEQDSSALEVHSKQNTWWGKGPKSTCIPLAKPIVRHNAFLVEGRIRNNFASFKPKLIKVLNCAGPICSKVPKIFHQTTDFLHLPFLCSLTPLPVESNKIQPQNRLHHHQHVLLRRFPPSPISNSAASTPELNGIP